MSVRCFTNRVHPLLGSEQGLTSGQQHPFPWYPPVCTSLSDIPEGPRSGDHLKAMKFRNKFSQKIPDTKLQQVCSHWLFLTMIIIELEISVNITVHMLLCVLFFFTPLPYKGTLHVSIGSAGALSHLHLLSTYTHYCFRPLCKSACGS